MENVKKITFEFNSRVNMWQALEEYEDGTGVTYMEPTLPLLAEVVLNKFSTPEPFLAK